MKAVILLDLPDDLPDIEQTINEMVWEMERRLRAQTLRQEVTANWAWIRSEYEG